MKLVLRSSFSISPQTLFYNSPLKGIVVQILPTIFTVITQNTISKNFKKKCVCRGSFSQREMQCLKLLLQGKSAKEIARILDLSPRTVEFYIRNMKKKTHCRTRSELILKALEKDL